MRDLFFFALLFLLIIAVQSCDDKGLQFGWAFDGVGHTVVFDRH